MKQKSSTGKAKTRRASRKTQSKRSRRYSTLTAQQKAEYGRSIDLLYDLRHGDDSYTKLLRKHRLDTRKAHRYLGSNLLGGTRGKRVRASKTDRLAREFLFPTGWGDVPSLVRGSKATSKLSDYYNDRDKLLDHKMSAEEFEAKWRGVRVNGRELYADAGGIFRMENAGVLKLENLYASVGSER
jgi:hypothetical protein